MIKLDILTPEWTRSLEADAVFIPGALGPFEVLKNHAPIISTLVEGEIRWRKDGNEDALAVKGGVMHLKNNIMRICAEV